MFDWQVPEVPAFDSTVPVFDARVWWERVRVRRPISNQLIRAARREFLEGSRRRLPPGEREDPSPAELGHRRLGTVARSGKRRGAVPKGRGTGVHIRFNNDESLTLTVLHHEQSADTHEENGRSGTVALPGEGGEA